MPWQLTEIEKKSLSTKIIQTEIDKAKIETN